MKYLAFLLILILGASLYFFEHEEDQELIEQQKNVSSNQSALDTLKINAPNFSNTAATDPIETLNPVDSDETFPGRGGFVYRSINDLSHEPELLKQLKEDLDNFKKYGSIGKGKTTIEFERTKDLQESLSKKGITSIVNGLAFNPTQIVNVAATEFSLIGADDQGKVIPDRGWNGLFQSFEDSATGRQIELSESQIETLLGDETEVIEEFLNDKVGDVRASVQVMKDSGGSDVFSIQWDDGDRSFTLNTKSFSREESMALATTILERYRMLPYKGWKTPYVLDPNNPLHRIAIQRDLQRTITKPQK